MAVATAPAHRLGVRAHAHMDEAGGMAGGLQGPLVYVAAGSQEVALWDVARSRAVQVCGSHTHIHVHTH